MKRKIILGFLTLVIGWLIFAEVGMKFRISDEDAVKKFKDAGVVLHFRNFTIDRFTLHYAKTGPDTLPTLFFIHGSPGSWMKFEKYLRDPDLLKKFRIISVDRPGYGFSEFGNVMNLEQQAKLITALLVNIDNGKPVYAIGRSYGGSMVARLAIDLPGRFSGLVLLAAALDPAAESPEKWRPVLFKTPLNYFVPGAWRTSNEELWYLKDELKHMVSGYSTIQCPVYILHGDNDDLVPVSNAHFGKQMFVKAPVYLQIIHGADHYVSDNNYDLVKAVLMKLY